MYNSLMFINLRKRKIEINKESIVSKCPVCGVNIDSKYVLILFEFGKCEKCKTPIWFSKSEIYNNKLFEATYLLHEGKFEEAIASYKSLMNLAGNLSRCLNKCTYNKDKYVVNYDDLESSCLFGMLLGYCGIKGKMTDHLEIEINNYHNINSVYDNQYYEKLKCNINYTQYKDIIDKIEELFQQSKIE